MTRMNDFSDVLFRVKVVPATALVETAAGTRQIRSPTARLIVDVDHDRVVGAVGNDYRVVTNEQALNWAYRCGQAVFPNTTAADWSVVSVDGPSTGSYCRIDIGHRQTILDFSLKSPGLLQEAFGPFIRVTNSFNGQRALRFDIGLLRRMCTNGVLITDTLVSFRFAHSKANLATTPEFTVDHPRLNAWLEGFDAGLATLRTRNMTADAIHDLVLGVLKLHPPVTPNASKFLVDEWAVIQKHLGSLISRYTSEVGENAYAAFNVMTDYATRPKGRGPYFREMHALQARVGTWFSDTCGMANRQGPELPAYLNRRRTTSSETAARTGR